MPLAHVAASAHTPSRAAWSRPFYVFPTMVKVGFAELVAYRSEVLIWVLTTTMPLIMYAVWSTIAHEAPIGRFDGAMFGAYFLSTLVVRQLASAWVVWELNYVIRTGQLSSLLLRPVHPLAYFAAMNLGALPFRLLILCPIVIGAFLALPEIHLELSWWRVLLFFETTILAWLLTFLIQSIFGMLALYTQQSLALQDAWFGVWSLLSGYLIPLELMPKVHDVAIWLPFRSMNALPTEIILGLLTGDALMQGLLVQVGWVVGVVIFVAFFWRRAIRRFEAFGN
ncbi:MAG: ABC-2 family transporter protein [Deltaproteobacteria bacterium]|nr:ABC-2 family transporter protein [Deltaproteobacteria bacterium]